MTLLQGGDHLQNLHHGRDHAQRQDGEGATNGKLGHKRKSHTKDGVLLAEILHQLKLVVYPIIYWVSAPSQVVQDFSHSMTECSKWFGFFSYPPLKLILKVAPTENSTMVGVDD